MKNSITLISCILVMTIVCLGCSSSVREESRGVTAGPTSPAETPNNNSTIQQDIEQIVLQNERKIWEAFKARDVDSANVLLADDAQIVTANGRFNKSEFLKLIPQFPEIPSYSIGNVKVVSPSKDLAILTYESRYTSREPELKSYRAFQTTVWVNRGGKWVAVFNQETQLQPR